MNKIIVIIIFLSTTLLAINKVQAKGKPPETIKTQNTEAQDHNSTRSNRGSIKVNNENINIQNRPQTRNKGRNPQTGKEINASAAKKKDRNSQADKNKDK